MNKDFKIWIDADACPVAVKEIVFKAAMRRKINLTLVANQVMRIPDSQYIDFIRVDSGFDVADQEIVKRLNPGDLIVTNDIPLAAEIIEKGGHPLSPRGEMFTQENIKTRLNIRDFMDSMRTSGIDTFGPAAFSKSDKEQFANQLDRFLTRVLSNSP